MSTPTQGPPAAAGKVVGIDDIDAVEVASQLRVLAHPARVTLLSLLFKNPVGEECGRVLAATIGLPETTVSHHLRQLRQAGFIESRRRGMHVYHRPHRETLGALCNALAPHTEPDAITRDTSTPDRGARVAHLSVTR